MTEERIRAERGAARMDVMDSPDWHWDPAFDDLSTLDISNSDDCVCGKRYGGWSFFGRSGYRIGCELLGLNPGGPVDNPFDYGFTGTHLQTKAWRELITERREAAISGLETGLEGVRTDETPVALSEHPVAV